MLFGKLGRNKRKQVSPLTKVIRNQATSNRCGFLVACVSQPGSVSISLLWRHR